MREPEIRSSEDEKLAKAAEAEYKIGLKRLESRNYSSALKHFNLAIIHDPQHTDALYTLGSLYQHAKGVKRDLAKAREYYAKAAEQNHAQSIKQIVIIDNPKRKLDSARQWCNLGRDYHLARNGKAQNCTAARICYKEAIRLDSDHADSLYLLGWLYQYGEGGVTADPDKAIRYYRKAARQHHAPSIKQILIIDNPKRQLDSAQSWYDLAEDHYLGRNTKKQSYVLARICYELTIKSDPNHINSLYSLGWLYQYGEGIPTDYDKARAYYLKAKKAASTSLEYSKFLSKRLKILERDIVLNLLENKGSINVKDAKNDTALHRAAKYKQLKNYARLMLMGANKGIENAESKKPSAYFNYAEISRITEHQYRITSLLTRLRKTAPEIIRNRILIHPAGKIDEQGMLNRLNEFHAIAAITPLLELAKLAILGLHNHSQRAKFTDAGYDSDNDDQEIFDDNKQALRITIDPEKEHVDNIAHLEGAGLEGKEVHGVFLNANQIYIGGNRDAPGKAGGTFIHELTHFVADEVFDNEFKPYAKDDPEHLKSFSQIAKELKDKQGSLDPILQNAFSPHYVNSRQVHAELIVRVPQIILTYPDGLAKITSHAPALYEYYVNFFLKKVEKHVKSLSARALSGWPPEKMISAAEPFNFEHVNAALPTQGLFPPHKERKEKDNLTKVSQGFNPF